MSLSYSEEYLDLHTIHPMHTNAHGDHHSLAAFNKDQ